MQNLNLKDIEKKIWKLNFEDGITDITIALFLIISTICQIFDEYRFSLYLLYMIPVTFSIVAKKQITAPRIGLIEYNQERNKKRHSLSFSITIFIFIIVAATVTGNLNPLQPLTPLFIGFTIITICGIIAFVLNYKRMYLYGLIITLSFAISEFSIYQIGNISSGAFAWLISAIIILSIGIYYLSEFVNKYPKPNLGEFHDN